MNDFIEKMLCGQPKTEVWAAIVLITGEMANEWLKCNFENNRALKPNVWRKYADEIQNGDFSLNTDAIAFNEEGELINGQHRLRAIANTGIPTRCLVVFNFPIEQKALGNIDIGSRRTPKDSLEVSGVNDPVILKGISVAGSYMKLKLGKALITTNEKEKFVREHYNDFKNVLEITMYSATGGSRIQALVVAAIFSAYVNKEDVNALRAFVRAYRLNDYSNCDGWNTQMVGRLRESYGVKTNKKPSFVLAESCIHAFCVNSKTLREREDYYMPLGK